MPGDISRLIGELATELGRITSHESAVERLVELAAASVGTDLAGITLIRARGRLETRAPTGSWAEQADRLQHDLREGPCVEAAAESRSFVSNDLSRDERWPTWGPAVARLGIHSVMAVDLNAGRRRIGALNLYGAEGLIFSEADLEVATLFAAVGAAMLGFVEQVDGLTTAIDNRTVIGQAQGIVMKQYDIDAEHAFDVLRRQSQNDNIKLVDVATRIVAACGSFD